MYSYRTARSDEQTELFQLYRSVMRIYIEQIWGWDEKWQGEDFSEHFEPAQITVILAGDKLVGYAQVEPQSEVLFVRMLLVKPEHQKKGLGASILARVLSEASERRLGVRLQVFKINEAAKLFYERHGFRVVRETPTSLEMEFDA